MNHWKTAFLTYEFFCFVVEMVNHTPIYPDELIKKYNGNVDDDAFLEEYIRR